MSSGALHEQRDRALAQLESELPAAVLLRHAVHADPRPGGDEFATTALVVEALDGVGSTHPVAEGMFVRIDGAGAANQGLPAVGIRAELDGLPIQERSDLPWRSARPGIAHLCGHDVHIAALVAATRTLAAVELPVPLVAVFQPREEVIPSGAQDFTRDTAMREQNVRAMIGVHVQPVIPAGMVSAAAGPVNASADDFEIVITGVPAHGAYPHLGRDPIVAAAAVVQALQHLVSRRIDPMNPSVLTIGKITGGDSHNQVPGTVTLLGTLRSFSEIDRRTLHAAVREVCDGTALAHGCTAAVDIRLGEPVLHNNPELALSVSRALEDDGMLQATPFRSCGADDFAFYGERFPSLMVFAGVGSGHGPGLHHPDFVPDDSTVRLIARIMVLSYFAAAGELLLD